MQLSPKILAMGLLITATLQSGSHKACEEWVGMNSCTYSPENMESLPTLNQDGTVQNQRLLQF